MADYKESALAGHKWQRCHRIIIDNELGKFPVLSFCEQEMATLSTDGGASNTTLVTNNFGLTMSVTVDSLADTFPLLHPETAEPLGSTMSYQDLYIALNSVYRKLAADRDATPKGSLS